MEKFKIKESVLVVGAGPIGIEVAVALQRAGISVCVFERGCLAETIFKYPTDTIFFSDTRELEISGYSFNLTHSGRPNKSEYLAYLRAVAKSEKLKIHFSTEVTRIDPKKGKICVSYISSPFEGHEKTSKLFFSQLVLCIGDLHTPRALGVSGENLPHVSHFLIDSHNYFGKNVVVVGGKHSALLAAISLAQAGANVTQCHRRPDFPRHRIKPWVIDQWERIHLRGEISFLPNSEIQRVEPGLAIIKTDSESKAIPCDNLLLMTGFDQEKHLFETAGVKLLERQQKPKINLDTLESDVENVFVAGTATAGTQFGAQVFIENCHNHAKKIAREIASRTTQRNEERD